MSFNKRHRLFAFFLIQFALGFVIGFGVRGASEGCKCLGCDACGVCRGCHCKKQDCGDARCKSPKRTGTDR